MAAYQILSAVDNREVPKRNIPLNLSLSLDDYQMLEQRIAESKAPWTRQLFIVHSLRYTDLSIGQGLITYPDLYECFKYGLCRLNSETDADTESIEVYASTARTIQREALHRRLTVPLLMEEIVACYLKTEELQAGRREA